MQMVKKKKALGWLCYITADATGRAKRRTDEQCFHIMKRFAVRSTGLRWAIIDVCIILRREYFGRHRA